MKLNQNHKILIVGLGLLGGSYAQALTKKGFEITAITKDQSSIDYALSRKMIAKGSSFVDEKLIEEADLVIFALYPHVFIDWIRENQHLFKSGTIITDVTGVKESVVATIQEMLRADVEFIAAHPMAGR
jgi:prephenate dehydrogenase